ncbi:MAG: glycosyltransferase family 2 protein [Desulfocapsa sp.]|uniref:Glycosyltransferase family 2 protein n=1 Tax=Desulfotalea psychrophila TaxID=84980 RepID=A0ABS3ATD3_9BACT|nr:glycosyltransferase family 2 protein [Desulfocapsa sp.]MBN4058694.1 glycosyltransferase family 2 protein [Desulfocapsa sp. AH-315-J15]MBN4068018.1 glycosyltransferase family 2 protein [Desulfotalea psychrophila]
MISIIIPTLNGGELFSKVLESIAMQEIHDEYELLVYDSASTDDTVKYAQSFGAEVVSVDRKNFDHGGTRTLAAQKAVGDILVFMTQDAVLVGCNSLALLIEPLRKNESSSVAVTYGRQLPNKDATPAAAHLRLFNYPPEPLVKTNNDKRKYGLKTVFVSNSFAAYKQDSLATCGYFKQGLIFGEDTCAVGRLLLEGYAIQYVSEAQVYHSHNYSLVEEFKRHFDIGVLHSAENWLLQEYGVAEGHGANYVRSAFSYFIRNNGWYLIPDLIIRSGMKYMGYKFGRNYKSLPVLLRMKLSMYSAWWKQGAVSECSNK